MRRTQYRPMYEWLNDMGTSFEKALGVAILVMKAISASQIASWRSEERIREPQSRYGTRAGGVTYVGLWHGRVPMLGPQAAHRRGCTGSEVGTDALLAAALGLPVYQQVFEVDALGRMEHNVGEAIGVVYLCSHLVVWGERSPITTEASLMPETEKECLLPHETLREARSCTWSIEAAGSRARTVMLPRSFF